MSLDAKSILPLLVLLLPLPFLPFTILLLLLLGPARPRLARRGKRPIVVGVGALLLQIDRVVRWTRPQLLRWVRAGDGDSGGGEVGEAAVGDAGFGEGDESGANHYSALQ